MALYSNTLAVARKYLSSAVGDLITGTFASGTTTTGVHTLLRKADDYYNEHAFRCYIFAGTNIGEEREVSDWVLSTNTLTFAPAFTSAIDNTSQYELHFMFTEDEYRRAINLAIESVADKYLIEKIDVATTLVADTYEYTLPTTMYYVYRITTEKTAAGGLFEEEDVIDPRDWRLISPRKLKLDEDLYTVSADKDLRIEGQGKQDTVTSDTGTILLKTDWLIQKAITFLPKGKIESNNLNDTYRQALALSAIYPRNNPNSKAQKVIE